MVFYFTATGNSLYVAKQLDSELVSIPQAIRQENQHYKADVIGVVCPVFGHEAPRMVQEFLKNATFETDYFYMVLTYGNIHGGAAELAEDMLRSFGKEANYINTILMVDNFLPAFDMDQQRETDPEKKVDEHLEIIRQDIRARKQWKQPVTDEDRNWHKMFLERAPRPAEGEEVPEPMRNFQMYRITEDCTSCGICTQVCPSACFSVADGKAVHSMSGCQMCLSCVHNCPQKAIQMNMPEKNPNARYRNEHVTLQEIIAANSQTV